MSHITDHAVSHTESVFNFSQADVETFWVNYWIVVPELFVDTNIGDQQNSSSDEQIQKSTKVYNEIIAKLKAIKYYKGTQHLWNWEPFQVSLTVFQGIPCLFGSTRTFDSMWDEMSIVYILRELSKIQTNAYIRVTDKSGEFLLYMGEELSLPIWAESSPDLSNAVWINQGKVNLIKKQPEDSAEDSGNASKLSFRDAVKVLRDPQAKDLIYSNTYIDTSVFMNIDSSYPLEPQTQRISLKLPLLLASYFKTHHAFGLGIFNSDDTSSVREKCTKVTNKLTEDTPGGEVYVQCCIAMTQNLYARIRAAYASVKPKEPLESFQMTYEHLESYYLKDLTELRDVRLLYDEDSVDYHFSKPDEYTDALQKAFIRHMKNDVYDELNYEIEESLASSEEALESAWKKLYMDLYEEELEKRMDLAKILAEIKTGTHHTLKYKYPTITEKDVAQWDCYIDSPDWYISIQNGVSDAEDELEDADAAIVAKLSDFFERETGYLGVDDDDSSSDESFDDTRVPKSSTTGNEFFEDAMFNRGSGIDSSSIEASITEDDFFEFFMKNALQLPPEELEKLRASMPDSTGKSESADSLDDDSFIDQFIKLDLSRQGLDVDEDLGSTSANLNESVLHSNDPVRGPAAQLYRQIGRDLPRSSGATNLSDKHK